jgi:hypothetical protein
MVWENSNPRRPGQSYTQSWRFVNTALVCFSIASPASLDYAQKVGANKSLSRSTASGLPGPQRIKQLRNFGPRSATIYLVGLKEDLRDDSFTIAKLASTGQCPVTKEEVTPPMSPRRLVAQTWLTTGLRT